LEQGAVGAEEGVLGETAVAITGTDVEGLALGLGVGIVTSINLTVTAESSLRDLTQDGIVFSGHPRNGLL
jgi:hypothetical protein